MPQLDICEDDKHFKCGVETTERLHQQFAIISKPLQVRNKVAYPDIKA